jgi:hypothetical protein
MDGFGYGVSITPINVGFYNAVAMAKWLTAVCV